MTSALFAVVGRRFGLYDRVVRENITAADTASGLIADLECRTKEDDIYWVVEVKDRHLTIEQMKVKIDGIRDRQVAEAFFVAQQGIPEAEFGEALKLIEREFASGHNLYVYDLDALADPLLAVLGEEGRREFLEEVGTQLDTYHSDLKHRQQWAELLRGT